MNEITFPYFGINLNVSKIALTVFGINITWYAVLIVASIIIALIICKKREGIYGINFQTILDLSLSLIPISIISARLYYVLFNLNYFMANPIEILNIKQGGLAIYGGIIGGIITCYVFAKKRKISILNLLDYLAPVLALRTSNRKMGKLYKRRSIWSRNK